jgi:hypothetical protein
MRLAMLDAANCARGNADPQDAEGRDGGRGGD